MRTNVNAIHRGDHGGLWVIDTGAPDFGGDPLPGAAKAVRIDLSSNKVDRICPFGPSVALPGSYVDDIRFPSQIVASVKSPPKSHSYRWPVLSQDSHEA
jgi:hypothetical protein